MADNNGSGQASARSRWHRLGCWIWLRIIMLVLVISTLIAYSVEVWRCGSFEPTGDALYDRYAKAVISRQKWMLFHGGKHHPTYLPDTLLAQWESEFGSDPRYWQLRYFCARHKGGFGSGGQLPAGMRSMYRIPTMILTGTRTWDIEPTQMERNAWEYLQEGVEKGAADWMTLEMLGGETTRRRSNAENEEMDALDNLGLEQDKLRKRRFELNSANEQAELARVSAIVDADPSQAWPYYWRAKYWFYYGESELALADLKAGNAAPNNVMSRTYPIGFLLDRMSKGDHLGSDLLAGAILEGDANSELFNWIKWKDIYKEAQLMVALGGDMETLQEMHLAACRLGMAEHTSAIELSVAATLESMLSDTMLVEYGADLTYQQRRTMKSMNSYAKSIHSYWASWSGQSGQYIRNYPRLVIYGMQLDVVSMGNTGAYLVHPNDNFYHPEKFWQYLKPRLYYNRALWLQEEQQASVEELRDSFEELEYVDLNTLEWPQKWGNPY